MTRKLTVAQTEEMHEAREELRKVFHPGDTVHTTLRHVSASGMTRYISVIATEDGQPYDISWLVAKALGQVGQVHNRYGGIKVTGCGMDMGFHLVYNLSRTLYPEYVCTGQDSDARRYCPSPDHVNGPDRTPRDGVTMHKDGYALNHRWL